MDPKKINEKLFNVQQSLLKDPPKKTGHNSFTNASYATLADIMNAIQAPFAEEKLLVRHRKKFARNREYIYTQVICAESGEFVSDRFPMMNIQDNHAYGSAQTYGRRYNLEAILGLISLDDDGQSAKNHISDVNKKQKHQQRQVRSNTL